MAGMESRVVAYRLKLDFGRSRPSRDIDDPVVAVARHQRVEQELVRSRNHRQCRKPRQPEPDRAAELQRRLDAEPVGDDDQEQRP